MKVGIIVFSNTGNTFSAAEELKKELVKKGHSVKIERIETEGDPQERGREIKFSKFPEPTGYDALLFGGPVWGFHLNPISNKYLTDMPPLKGKKTVVFCTKDLKPHWTGGNQSIKKMKKLVEAKGGNVIGTGIIIWKKKGPTDDMPGRVKKIADLL